MVEANTATIARQDTVTDWRDRAAEAYRQRERDRQSAERETYQRQAGKLEVLLRRLFGISAIADGPRTIVDGTIFVLRSYDGRSHVAIERCCARCGKLVASGSIGDLAELGKQLAQFTPAYHECAGDELGAVRETLGGQLESLIRQIVHEEMEG